MKRLIICLTGMPGAGKSTIANLLKDKNFYVVVMGDVIREKAIEKDIELTDENLGNLMKNLRRDHGNEIIAKLILQKVKKIDQCRNFIAIDGIRSYEEFKVIKEENFAKLLAIHASSTIRFQHIKKRDRSDSPPNYKKFSDRDKREIEVGISEAIAFADEIVSNNTVSITEFKNNVEKIVEKWITDFKNFESKDIITI